LNSKTIPFALNLRIEMQISYFCKLLLPLNCIFVIAEDLTYLFLFPAYLRIFCGRHIIFLLEYSSGLEIFFFIEDRIIFIENLTLFIFPQFFANLLETSFCFRLLSRTIFSINSTSSFVPIFHSQILSLISWNNRVKLFFKFEC
jgi:hypothetical protein